MGKKPKVGKARKDKFYHLAKETGYRARSAFKLLQLNRKFEFLQKSRVCIDLCAAPGGWLQVASECMPMSSIIIGVDLVPIKPVPKCSTYQEDITSDKCRQVIKKELQTWKADVVLHDGAPNVGKNWVHDAFAQAELTLSALKLATTFMKKGGWFITKVFRSKDYQTLIWVFGQMFKKVHATKPKASRNESAEIFVVCQGYLAPDKIDPKFLDPQHVFKDINTDARPAINLIHPEKVKKNAEGYADGMHVFFNNVNVSEFIRADNHLEVLASSSELVLDDESIRDHPLTTGEIKLCFKDIRVLGKKELRDILTWRKKMVDFLEKQKEEKDGKTGKTDEEEAMEVDKVKTKSQSKQVASLTQVEAVDMGESESSGEDSETGNDEDDEEEEKVKEQLADLKDEERRTTKRKRKKVMKEKRKLRDKMSLNMVIPGDHLDITDDVSLFDLKKIKNKQQLTDVEKEQMSDHEDLDMTETDELSHRRKKLMAYDRYSARPDATGYSEDEDDLELDDQKSGDEDLGPLPEASENPLVVEMESKEARAKNKADMWFKKAGFADLEEEADEDLEIEKMTEKLKQRGAHLLIGRDDKKSMKQKKRKKLADEDVTEDAVDDNTLHKSQRQVKDTESQDSADDSDDDSDSDSSSASDSDYDMYSGGLSGGKANKSETGGKSELSNKAKKDGFEIVSEEATARRKITKLDPIELAIGEEMIYSAKRRRQIIDDSYNRYTFGEENLPEWFVKDESRHMKRQLPVSKAQVAMYRERLKAINTRPIKKIAEAEARKKKRMMRKMERARAKAEKITEAVDTSNKEKMKAIKEVYKKAGVLKKKKEDVQYVVAKRGTGRKVSRPAGIKGRFKVVDPRMKKDLQKQKIRDRMANKKKGGKGKKQGGGGRKR